MNKTQLIEALKLTGAGSAILIGVFMFFFFFPFYTFFVFGIAIFLFMAYFLGYTMQEARKDNGKRNRK